jgi:L-aminopeptidase/D-esterase-like protein
VTRHNDITDVTGVRVGRAEDRAGLTGCTVLLFPEDGAVAGMEQVGGAPGTRETDLLKTLHLVQRIHGLALSGGSAFGLNAAAGVVSHLESEGIGFPTGSARVPIVPSAVIYDLGLGNPAARPDADMGRRAAEAAAGGRGPIPQGSVGAGTGATVGKILGMEWAMKGGEGSASVPLPDGTVVGALAVVNAFGDVVDPRTSEILAGARNPSGDPRCVDTQRVLKERAGMGSLTFGRQDGHVDRPPDAARGSGDPGTVLGVVAVSAELSKEEVNIVARMAVAGLARTIRPAFTLLDGDTVFAVATGGRRTDVSTIGAVAAEALEEAILRGIREADALGGAPAYKDGRG